MVPRVALRDGPLRACLLAGSGGFRQSWASFDLQPHPSGLCPHLPILSPECLCLPVTFSCLCVPMQMPLFQRHRLHWIWDPSSSGMTSPLPVTKTYFQARSRSQALGVRTSTCWGEGEGSIRPTAPSLCHALKHFLSTSHPTLHVHVRNEKRVHHIKVV